jgi:hypothetical protein
MLIRACLYELQFGFRAKHSTNHALINITEEISQALDNKKLACGVFVDFQKAFDTVNHSILVQKLSHYGIRGIAKDWLASYLSHRSQFVSYWGLNLLNFLLIMGFLRGQFLDLCYFLFTLMTYTIPSFTAGYITLLMTQTYLTLIPLLKNFKNKSILI